MFNEEKYKDFTAHDFICDTDFQEWIIHRTAEGDLFWNRFIEEHPDKKEACETARAFLTNIRFKEDIPDEDHIRKSFANHMAQIQLLNPSKAEENGKVINMINPFRFKRMLGVAVIVGVLVVLSALFFVLNQQKPIIVQNGFGEIKSVVLPDNSKVVLNANSKIRYHKNWQGKIREVWLEGEAFFEVRHLSQDSNQVKENDRFLVHTNEITVEVLGTAFDIRERRGKAEVVLQAGHIKVSLKDTKKAAVLMWPGDMLSYYEQTGVMNRTTTNAENFTAWREKKLILNDPTVGEIVQYLEDYFGKKIILGSTESANRKIEGPILLSDLDDALFILSTVLNTDIIKKDSATILIEPK